MLFSAHVVSHFRFELAFLLINLSCQNNDFDLPDSKGRSLSFENVGSSTILSLSKDKIYIYYTNGIDRPSQVYTINGYLAHSFKLEKDNKILKCVLVVYTGKDQSLFFNDLVEIWYIDVNKRFCKPILKSSNFTFAINRSFSHICYEDASEIYDYKYSVINIFDMNSLTLISRTLFKEFNDNTSFCSSITYENNGFKLIFSDIEKYFCERYIFDPELLINNW